jgi:Fe-S oxidoreductase
MGLIYWWARLASKAPRLANLLTHAPVIGSLVKRAGGIAPERNVPPFAEQTFVEWFRGRASPSVAAPNGTVLLWPDTFANFFHPEVGRAHVEVLEAAGYRVTLPDRPLCCGRPLYDYGMLDTAERLLRQVLDALRPQIQSGVSLIGMDPSCLAVFRDELPNLFPHDHDAKQLSEQSVMLSEFLAREAPEHEFRLPDLLGQRALVQRHCHHQAVMGFESDQRVMDLMGLETEVPDSGCCGLAGSFGFEAGRKYEVSMKAGERVLFPAVRDAQEDTLLIADGFSCRTQIEHGTGRRARHLAEVIAEGLREEGRSSDQITPTEVTANSRRTRTVLKLGAVVAGLTAVRGVIRYRQRRP